MPKIIYNIQTNKGKLGDLKSSNPLLFLGTINEKKFDEIDTGKNLKTIRSEYEVFLNSLNKGLFEVQLIDIDGDTKTFRIARVY